MKIKLGRRIDTTFARARAQSGNTIANIGVDLRIKLQLNIWLPIRRAVREHPI